MAKPALEKPYIAPKPQPPETSWWADPGLSREQFRAKLAQELPRMVQSRVAAYVNPSARFAE